MFLFYSMLLSKIRIRRKLWINCLRRCRHPATDTPCLFYYDDAMGKCKLSFSSLHLRMLLNDWLTDCAAWETTRTKNEGTLHNLSFYHPPTTPPYPPPLHTPICCSPSLNDDDDNRETARTLPRTSTLHRIIRTFGISWPQQQCGVVEPTASAVGNCYTTLGGYISQFQNTCAQTQSS